MSKLIKTNKNLNLKAIDLDKPEVIKTIKFLSDDKTKELSELKSYQRLLRLTDCEKTSLALLKQNIHSVFNITNMARTTFVKEYAKFCKENGKASKQKAGNIYDKAVAKKNQVVNTYVAIAQQKSPFYEATRFDNYSQATDMNFNGVPSYQDLFGEVDFCSCPECRTIFSPAAYFVDLMSMQSKYILQPNEELKLTARRSDLETIELSCKNTNELVPTISIVNEVLINSLNDKAENYEILNSAKYPFNLPFNKPLSDINTLLKTNDLSLFKVYKELNNKPFFQIQENSIYFDILGITQEQWDIFINDLTTTKDLSSYYGYDTNNTSLVKDLTPIDIFLEKTNLNYPELNELLFEDLSCEEIKPGEISSKFFINQGTENILTTTVQEAICENKSPNKEELINLDIVHLSNINRFVRLAKAIGFSFIELDWALRTIGFITTGEDKAILDDSSLPYLAWFKQIKESNPKLSMEEICAIQGLMKDYDNKDSKSLFNRVYNNKNVPNPPKWPDEEIKWKVPPLDSDDIDDKNQQIQTALTSALKISEVELILVARQILDNKTAELPLSLENLSILYRFSLLPKILKLSIEEIFTVLSFSGIEDGLNTIVEYSKNLQDLLVYLEQFSIWSKKVSLNTYEVEYLLTEKSQNPKIQNQVIDEKNLNNLEEELREELETTLIKKEFLEVVLGIYGDYNQYSQEAQEFIFNTIKEENTEDIEPIVTAIFPEADYENKKQRVEYLTNIVTLHKDDTIDIFKKETKSAFTQAMSSDYLIDTLWEKLSANYIFEGIVTNIDFKNKDTFFNDLLFCKDLDANKPSGTFTLLNDKLKEIIPPFLQSNYDIQQSIYKNAISNFLNMKQDTFDILIQNLEIEKNRILLIEDFLQTNISKEFILEALQKLQKYSVIINKFNLSQLDVKSIILNPGSYNYTNNISIEFINSLYNYKSLQVEFEDTQNLFSSLINDQEKIDNPIKQLHNITGWNTKELDFLIPKVDISVPVSIDDISMINSWFSFSQSSNLDITTIYNIFELTQNSNMSYEKIEELSFSIWGGFVKIYEDTPSKLKNIKANMEVITRDYLAPYVLSIKIKENLRINNLRDLSNYLLIDIEVGSEIETSIIKSAISTVQLYVYRCLNNLEKDIDVLDNFESWWEWMANYRVWEANRKVFIFPENYIEPELRTDKTPQFTQLETNLQQANLQDPANVENVVSSYLDSFSQVANLSIDSSAGYDYTTQINTGEVRDEHDEKVQESFKNFCFIGKTKDEPFSYYYRMSKFISQENSYIPIEWGAWKEINIPFQPIGPVKPFFAFGKWFIFWLEQLQTGESEEEVNGKIVKTPLYTIYCKCSYLNFNNEWVVPKTIKELVPNEHYHTQENLKKAKELNDKDKLKEAILELNAWNQVYISYMNSLNILVLTYGLDTEGKALYKFTYGDNYLTNNLVSATRYISKDMPNSIYEIPYGNQELSFDNEKKYSYWSKHENDSNSYNSLTLLTWANLTKSTEGYMAKVDFNFMSEQMKFSLNNNKGKAQYKFNKKTYNTNIDISKDNWNLLALKPQLVAPLDSDLNFKEEDLNTDKYNYNAFTYKNKTYITSVDCCVYFDNSIKVYKNKKVNSFFLSIIDNTKEITDSTEIKIATPITIVSDIGLFYFQEELYAFWLTIPNSSSNNMVLNIGKVDLENRIIKDYYQVDNIKTHQGNILTGIYSFFLPSIVVYEEKIYCSFISSETNGSLTNSNAVFLGNLLFQGDKIIFERFGEDLSLSSRFQPTLFIDENILYIFTNNAYKWDVANYDLNNKTINPQMDKSDLEGSCDFIRQSYKVYTSITRVDGELYLGITGSANKEGIISFQKISIDSNKISTKENCLCKVIDGLDLGLCCPIIINNEISFLYMKRRSSLNHLILSSPAYLMVDFNGNYLKSDYISDDDYVKYNGNISYQYTLPQDGSYQEILVYKENISSNDMKSYYDNTKHFISKNYTNIVNNPKANYSLDIEPIAIINEPGWQTFSKDGIEILSTFDKDNKMVCYRLNTTANNYLNEKLFLQGINGLLSINSQYSKELPFSILKLNSDKVSKNTPKDTIDFGNSPMSKYYWEIFFYMPYLIAKSLQTAQQNSFAKNWYEYIFNPTINLANDDTFDDKNKNDKFWRFIGLRSSYNPTLAQELSQTWSDEIKDDTQNPIQLYAYHNDPFEPHIIAKARPIAYQKSIVMHYINNLITWGDKLFREYTVESIVEASMHYITAYDLLGEEPTYLGECPLLKDEDLKTLVAKYGNLENIPEFLIDLENKSANPLLVFKGGDTPVSYLPNLYFELPENEQLMEYWDIVQERLFNIRHGLNIEGVKQKLALFEPAINPAQLVAQIDSGGSLSSAKSFLNTTIPYYRYSVVLQLAKGTTQSVIQFGQSLLSALEKKDAEKLNLLQNQHQLVLLEQSTGVKQAQVDSIEQTIESLQYSLKGAEDRYEHYTKLLEKGLSELEESQAALSSAAGVASAVGAGFRGASIPAYVAPNTFGLANGGMNIGRSVEIGALIADATANGLNQSASIVGTFGSYQRREQDWKLQQKLAKNDKEQITYQIESSKYQLQVAKDEVKSQEKNIKQLEEVQQILKSKFTNEQLYQWMVSRLSSLFFQTYQLALDISMQAQQAWNFEKGVERSFIKGNYWDGLYDGLLSGESLMLSLNQMENAYMQENKRRLEIQKSISLNTLMPEVITDLKDQGECIFDFNEKLFDDDYAGMYNRQIASISVTIPAVVGPYENIKATLTQLRNATILKPDIEAVKYLNNVEEGDNKNIREDIQVNQQIAISIGVNDSGMFSLNFNDERYLPFEGTGAVSTWMLVINNNKTIRDNISDVIVHINYTALQGSLAFAKEVSEIDKNTPMNLEE